MWKLFDDFEEILADDLFEERPVDLKTFVESPEFMGDPPLSDKQAHVLEAMTQIYYPETIEKAYDDPHYVGYLQSLNINEVIAMVGKGGGKNHITTIAMCRVVYLLMCLKDPAKYFGFPTGTAIDLLNVAVNSTQAKTTFFKPFRERVRNCRWFEGKYTDSRSGEIHFEDKNINCYSGHSQREAWEGFNFIFVVLDEIAAFKTEQESKGLSARADTAPEIYESYKNAIISRYPDTGKLCLLSFPRFKGDFITQRWDEAVGDSEVIEYSKEMMLDPNGPDTEANKIEVSWFEEEPLWYEEPFVMAVRVPSFRFSPVRQLQDYVTAYNRNKPSALTRFFCNPPDAEDAFFTDKETLEESFKEVRMPFLDGWRFHPKFVGDKSVDYYVHVDLAQKSDRAAVAVSHVEGWETMGEGAVKSVEPVIKLDCVRWWTPEGGNNVDFRDVKQFITALRRRGFHLKKVTFDRWAGSIGLQNELAREGIEVETLSVKREQYNDLMLAIYDKRLNGYRVPLLVDELLGLQIDDKGRVDHTASGSNDLADAVCGSVHLCMKYEERPQIGEIEVYTLDEDSETSLVGAIRGKKQQEERKQIEEQREMPSDVQEFLSAHVI